MSCPESEILAAHVEGGLEPAESAALLEHAADCESCRRELALLELARAGAGAGLPSRLRARALTSRHRTFARPSSGRPAALVAAALLLAAAGLSWFAWRHAPLPPAPSTARRERPPVPPPAPAPEPPNFVEAPAEPPVPPAPAVELPEAPPPAPAAPPPAPLPVPEPAETPKPAETRTEVVAPPEHGIAARVLTDITLTDVSGALTLRRKGTSTKEKLSGLARVSEGDVLTCEKAAGFRVAGAHPVVLGENTTVSLGWAAKEEAPFVRVSAGELTIDSTGPARWILSDGTVALTVMRAQARFAAAPGRGLRVSALLEPLYVRPDGGSLHALRPGEELEVGKASAETRRADPAMTERALAAFHAARPRQRTLFFTSCDPADVKREQVFVQEGGFLKNEALLAKERADRSAGVALAPNPRFAWGPKLALRFRFRTNARAVGATLRCEERRYSLVKDVAVDRRQINAWVAVEIPLPIHEGAMGFSRDDGLNQITFTTEDKFDVLRFEVKAKDVFGDGKPYLLIDDIQVVAKE